MAAIWMSVTKDEFELPLVVADSAAELARILGLTRCAVSSCISKARDNGTRCKYVKVEVEDD